MDKLERHTSFIFNAPPMVGALRVRLTPDKLESYSDRLGYQATFIDKNSPIPLPKAKKKAAADIVPLIDGAARKTEQKSGELKYTHFSVKVSKSRRLPLFSAVNIDGSADQSGVKRTNIWKFDPRIPIKYQIIQECYGVETKGYFSRGHMTRREDPNWGTRAVAIAADADTFHATNAAPQMQGFNAGIWNSLEDYLLKNANKTNMKVSVFSGPIFSADDPVVHGVQIPIEFWKVIAFIHDQTAKLTATAYIGSQASYLDKRPKPSFVFGKFDNWQTPISRIELLTNLDFETLRRVDPLNSAGSDFLHALRKPQDIVLE